MNPTIPVKTLARRLLLLALCGASAISAQAAGTIIGLNIDETDAQNRAAMAPTHLAGVGVNRVANWNNVKAGTATVANGADLKYNDGSTVGGSFKATFNLATTHLNPGALINDAMLYAGYSEIQSTGYSIVLTDIPFENYAIYVFARGSTSVSNRGGSIGIGAQTFYIRGNLAPANDGTGYVMASSTTYDAGNPSLVASANYALFNNLTGANQTISLSALNMGNAANRLMISGIQIVNLSQIPEPSSAAALAGVFGLAFVIVARRRTIRR